MSRGFIRRLLHNLRHRQTRYVVEECEVFGDGTRVVWTSDPLPNKYAEVLKNRLAINAYKHGYDTWFRVVPHVND